MDGATTRIPCRFAVMLLLLCTACATLNSPGQLRGAWRPETYLLRDGAKHAVDGSLFFTASDWTVLFFVKGADGRPQRGSGEGGTFERHGSQLVLWHHYHLSAGQAMEGLPESALRMAAADPTAEPGSAELCRFEIAGGVLTLRFPSGNAMTFRRSSGP